MLLFSPSRTHLLMMIVCVFFSRNSTSRRHLRPLKRLPGAKQRRQRRHAGLSVPRLQVRQNLPLRRISLARLVCDRGLTIVVAVFSFHRYCSLKCAHTHTHRGGIQGVHADQVRTRVLGEPDDSSFAQDACTGSGCRAGMNSSSSSLFISTHRTSFPFFFPLFLPLIHRTEISFPHVSS